MRRMLASLFALTLVAGACSSDQGSDTASADRAGSASSTTGSAATVGEQPNIVYVLADDMTVDDLRHMPTLRRLVGEDGVTFDRSYVSVSLCCPSRTSMLRGQYSHNTGIESNRGNGGFVHFHEQGLEESTIGTWLQDAGYRTAFIGKYLNDYAIGAGDDYVPPGWDEWLVPVAKEEPPNTYPSEYNQYNYRLNDNGSVVDRGDAPQDYAGRVYLRRTREFITRAVEDGTPFYAALNVVVPHWPATPDPRDVRAVPDAVAPRTASFDQQDVATAPGWVQDLPRLTDYDRRFIDGFFRQRVRSLIGLDRTIGRLVATLDELGVLDDTFVVFTSDNGHHLGQHRMQSGKQTGYEEDIHVPLLVRGPGVPAGVRSEAFVANIDLAPTFAELTGAEVPEFVDGRSFAATLGDPTVPTGREALLIEHWKEEPGPGEELGGAGQQDVTPEFHGIRTARYTYIEYDGGDIELYDNLEDPDQLENLAGTAEPELLDALHDRVAALVDCVADTCREAENADVPA